MWQITKKGEEILYPDTNAKMVWCPHHKSSDGVVNGMYMTAPHDYDAWKAAKDQKRLLIVSPSVRLKLNVKLRVTNHPRNLALTTTKCQG